ncbi:signal peptidase II [Paeniglutamicibacter gangotriensis]|uniref:Lipoprotein signal peptidase n=1 Tax=Paeniglutamicibacter gangotriensis TaxID=254787 RepID=A0A5B0EQ32_9MICC|nr:signal peptidase II [Paeniglutamicibacter gangotriensis]
MLVTVLLAAVALVLDQLTKRVVETTMEVGQSIDVFAPLLRWYYIKNSGAAFSMGEGFTWIFTIIQAAVLIYVAVFLVRKIRVWPWALALGGLMGGVAGNLTDRLFREPSFGNGHVVDFIALPNFAIFNVADMFIVCSMIGICLLLFTGRELDGSKSGAAKPNPKLNGNDGQETP